MRFGRFAVQSLLAVSVALVAAGDALAACWWMEVRGGGHKDSTLSYAESTGTGWADTSAHSLAPEDPVNFPGVVLTSGIGGRYTTNTAAVGTFTFTPIETGEYEVFVTWGTTSNGDTDVLYTLNYEGGSYVQHFNQYLGNGNNAWNQVGGAAAKFMMNAGTPYTLVATNPTHEGPAGASTRLMTDAVVFRKPGCGDVPAVTVKVPVIVGDTKVIVQGVSGATSVGVYANKVEIGRNNAPGTGDVEVTTSPLTAGVHINATQTVDGNESCVLQDGPIPSDGSQIPAVTVAGAYIPPGNTVFAPVLLAGDTKVRVSGVRSDATKVTVYANQVAIGSNSAPGGAADVDVNVSALQAGAVISATQTLPSFSQSGVALEGVVPTTGPVVGSADQVPVVSVVGLADAGRAKVRVRGVSSYASAVTIYDETAAAVIGTNNAPTAGVTVVDVSPLVEGHIIKAKQAIRVDGALGAGRRVMAASMIEDFEPGPGTTDDFTASRIVGNPPLGGGSYRIWYNVNDVGYCVTTPTIDTLFGSQCIRYSDNGWTNGMYAIYEQIIPETGTYHLQMQMLIDEVNCGDPDWINQFQVGVTVNGTHRSPAGTIAPCSLIGNYVGQLTAQIDGTDATQAIVVYSATITANAGDDLLIAFATDVTTYSRAKTNTSPFAGMKIDNIKLNVGPKPCQPQDVPQVGVSPASDTTLLEAGATEVMVTGVSLSASEVYVYEYTPSPDTWTLIGSAAAGAQNVLVALTQPLVAHKVIVATQKMTVCDPPEVIEGEKLTTGPVVGMGKNSPVLLSLGIRETNNPSPCAIGTDGGTTGTSIEWIGPSSTVGGAPQGKILNPSTEWQTVTFDPVSDPILSFNAGNGVLSGACGVLEHLAVATKGANTGSYTLLIDNVMSGSTLVEDFESATANDMVLFRQPSYSGTTSVNLFAPPNVARVIDTDGDNSSKCLEVRFQFYDEQPKRWVRLTTASTTAAPLTRGNPIVDLAQPITMRVKFVGMTCNDPFADVDGDGDVDQTDFAAFQVCFTGPGGTLASGCECFDRLDDKDVDSDDAGLFEACASGAGIAADPDCD